MTDTLQVLSKDDAYHFMVAYTDLTPSEKNVVLYFLENDLYFKGNFSELSRDMGYRDTYYAEIHRACHRLQDAKILEICEPLTGYTRTITMSKEWIDILVKIGKEKTECTQDQCSSTPLINWEITR